ncbi:MAG: hypothetical protein SCH71_16950 [Desulfobulbaceae bacterium]|nr:hypothetical protein [Desulfobulbaceae bacterium]
MKKIIAAISLLLSAYAYAGDSHLKTLFIENSEKIEAFRDLSVDCKIEIQVRGRKAIDTQACQDFIKVSGDMNPMIKAIQSPESEENMKDPAIIDISIQLLEGIQNFKYIVYRLTN